MRIEFNKLVRDKIPNIIENDSDVESVRYHKCSNKTEMITYILDKIEEEVSELKESFLDEELSLEEFIDVIEVIDKLKYEMNWTSDEIEAARKAKQENKGMFNYVWILESIDYKE